LVQSSRQAKLAGLPLEVTGNAQGVLQTWYKSGNFMSTLTRHLGITSAVRAARSLGIIVQREHRSHANGYHYETVLLGNPLAPWLVPEFAALYEAVKDHTLVDAQRCYDLWDLAKQVAHLPGDMLEVGVWRGGSGCVIAAAAPEKAAYLCDTFAGVVKATDRDSFYRGGEHADTSLARVRVLAERIGLKNVHPVQGIFPDDHPDEFTSKTFAFVHIDVDVYQSAKDVLGFVWPRLSLGGVVVFDDYGVATCNGITRVVDESKGHDRIVTYNLNGHAVMVKVK
jgi:O-methyltransferase